MQPVSECFARMARVFIWVQSHSECAVFVVRTAEFHRFDKDRMAWRRASCMTPGAGAHEFLMFRCSATRALILTFLEDITLKRADKGQRAESVSDNR